MDEDAVLEDEERILLDGVGAVLGLVVVEVGGAEGVDLCMVK